MISEEEWQARLIEVLSALTVECHGAAVERGFWDGVNTATDTFHLPTLLMLIVSELGEAMEAHRHNPPLMSDHIPAFTGVEEELADVFIRGFDLAGGYNLNLAGAVLAKMEFNATREYKHGKSY